MSAPGGGGAPAVFIDSGAFFALSDPKEANHHPARAIATRLTGERWQAYTTNFVVAETHALVLSRRGQIVARRVLAEIDRGSIGAIIRVEVADETRAQQIIHRYTDKDSSLTGAISFAVMERAGIDHAFTFDRHFVQYGFTAVGPAPPS